MFLLDGMVDLPPESWTKSREAATLLEFERSEVEARAQMNPELSDSGHGGAV